MPQGPFSRGPAPFREKVSPCRNGGAARRIERDDHWDTRCACDLISEAQAVPVLETYEDESRTTEQSECKRNDGCFDGEAVPGG